MADPMIYRFRPASQTPGSATPSVPDPRREQLDTWLRQIFAAGLRASRPETLVAKTVRREGDCLAVLGSGGKRLLWPIDSHPRIWLMAAGKAAAGMTDAIFPLLGNRIAGGLVVTPAGYPGPRSPLNHLQAGHPLPDARGQLAARVWLGTLRDVHHEDLVLVLLSGGASALLPAPVPGISLDDKSRTIQTLLLRGADIRELNTVRKHLSLLKGGRMVERMQPASLLSLVVSDVVDGDLSVIASGPTVPDPSSFAQALAVMRRYECLNEVPLSVRSHLERGADGLEEETPKPGDPTFRRTNTVLLADNRHLLTACADEARNLGLNTVVLDSCLSGEASTVGRGLAQRLLEVRRTDMPFRAPACIIGGGETTVHVVGNGVGGRNQELALSAAITLAGNHGLALLSAASDGVDGPTSAAGAIAFADTLVRARLQGLSLKEALARNDSHTLFDALGDLVVTGPTGTNLLDVQIAIVL